MRKVIRSIFLLLIGFACYFVFKIFDKPQLEPLVIVGENREPQNVLQPLQFNNVIDKSTGNYFDLDDQSNMQEIHKSRIFTVSGFQFCKILNGATFDSLVDLKDFGSSVAESNPDVNNFINLIDSRAYDIYQALLRKVHVAEKTEVKRLACYTAGEGQTVVANLTYNRLLQEVHPINYFKDLLKTIIPNPAKVKKQYKLAYLIMAHDKNGFAALIKLLELLDDGQAIILIHIDARPSSNSLFDSTSQYLHDRKLYNPNSAIFMAKHRFANIWGHISLVLTQLSGFWELLDLADWDYVINLSNYDYPLKKNTQIHRYLSEPQHNNKNFIQYWQDTCNLY